MSEKVRVIKEAIENGTYKMDVETTAEKLTLLFELEML